MFELVFTRLLHYGVMNQHSIDACENCMEMDAVELVDLGFFLYLNAFFLRERVFKESIVKVFERHFLTQFERKFVIG